MAHFILPGLSPLRTQFLSKGESLFRAGDKVTHLYFITSGAVKMIRHLEDGTAVCLFTAGSGQVFAEASLFSEKYHCDAISETDVSLDLYLKKDILNSFQTNTETAFKFMAFQARQIQHLRAHIEIINIKSAPARVLAFIHSLLEPGQHEILLNRTWKSVASEIGLSHEAMYRALAKLQKDKIIFRNGRSIAIQKNTTSQNLRPPC